MSMNMIIKINNKNNINSKLATQTEETTEVKNELLLKDAQDYEQENSNQNLCRICLDQLENSCIIIPCCHSYHQICIETWLKQSQRCPLCNIEMEFLQQGDILKKVSDIVDEHIINSQSQDNVENKQVEAFECLDHSYLKNEVDKLMYKLDFILGKMESNHAKHDDFHWFVAEEIERNVQDLEDIVKFFKEFDPSKAAQQCVTLEEHLDAMMNNKWTKLEDAYTDLYLIQIQKEEDSLMSFSVVTKQKSKKKSKKLEEDDNDCASDNFFAGQKGSRKDCTVKQHKQKPPKKNKVGIPISSFPSLTKE